eukprot:2611510-Amphidinium_carterae.1
MRKAICPPTQCTVLKGKATVALRKCQRLTSALRHEDSRRTGNQPTMRNPLFWEGQAPVETQGAELRKCQNQLPVLWLCAR